MLSTRALTVVLCLILSGALSACATDRVSYIPPTLLECKDAPKRPSGEELQGARGANIAASYVVNLRGAYTDCKGNLGAVKELVSGQARRSD